MAQEHSPQGPNDEQVGAVATSCDVDKPRQDTGKDSRALAEVDPPTVDGDTGSDLARLQSKVAEQEETIKAQREQILRAAADFENYRRRQQNSLEDVKYLAREAIMTNVLPLVDNLERALAAMQSSGNVQALEEGIRLILKQMKDILEREGLTEIQADGELFDPSLHEAVMTEARDDIPEQTVVETLQKGYRLGSRVLRPSLVKVSSTTG